MVNSTFSFESTLGKDDVLRLPQCYSGKWPGQQTMGESQAPAIFQYPQYSSSHVHVSPGWKWYFCAGGSPCLSRQSEGGELLSLWAEWGMLGSQQYAGKGGIVLWKPERGRGVSTVASPYRQHVPGPQWDQIDWKQKSERERELHFPAAPEIPCPTDLTELWYLVEAQCSTVCEWWYCREVDDVVFDSVGIFHCGSHFVFRDICKGE